MPGFAFGADDIVGGKGPNPAVNTARTYRWRISKLGPVSANSISGTSTQWYAKSLTFPTMGATIEEAIGSTVKYKFAGHVDYSTCSVTLYNVMTSSGTSIKTFLENWGASIYGAESRQQNSQSGKTNFNKTHVADDYKDTSIFSLRDEIGRDQTQLTLHNSWPLKVSHTQLDYSKNELAEVTLELVFDWYSIESERTSSGNTAPNREVVNTLRSRLEI